MIGATDAIMRRHFIKGKARADGAFIGRGIQLKGTHGAIVEGNEIINVWKCISGDKNQSNLTIRRNNLHDYRSDGIGLGNIDGIFIYENHIHNRSGTMVQADHRDGIQLQGGGTNIKIYWNVLDMGNGEYGQVIFGGKPIDTISIFQNEIYGSHTHGISLGNAVNVSVYENSLFWIPRSGASNEGITKPKINIKGSNVLIQHNITVGLVANSSILEGNETIGDASDYTDLDANGKPIDPNAVVIRLNRANATNRRNKFAIKAGSRLDGKGAPSVAVV